MAITDRNLSVGTKLYARYKGATHTAEVVLNPEATGDRPIAYKVEGKEQLFKSPSAAGTAVTGLACNGWAFWSVGEPPIEGAKTAKASKGKPTATITPAPKPQGKRRGRKGQTAEPPASDGAATADAPPSEPADDAPLETIRCAECDEEFQGVQAATEHYYATHGAPEGDEPTA